MSSDFWVILLAAGSGFLLFTVGVLAMNLPRSSGWQIIARWPVRGPMPTGEPRAAAWGCGLILIAAVFFYVAIWKLLEVFGWLG